MKTNLYKAKLEIKSLPKDRREVTIYVGARNISEAVDQVAEDLGANEDIINIEQMSEECYIRSEY